jgi:uncharacterized protein (TIGR02391 family)
MAGPDRSPLASLLERVRDAALAVEATTSFTPIDRALSTRKGPSPNLLYDVLISGAALRKSTQKLFHDGHYAEAVRKAFVLVNNEVKSRTGSAKDGAELMNRAFGTATPELRLNAGLTQSDHDEQEGYRFIFAGAMTGIRNPRSHDPIADDPESALEMIVLANHLLRVLARAIVGATP